MTHPVNDATSVNAEMSADKKQRALMFAFAVVVGSIAGCSQTQSNKDSAPAQPCASTNHIIGYIGLATGNPSPTTLAAEEADTGTATLGPRRAPPAVLEGVGPRPIRRVVIIDAAPGSEQHPVPTVGPRVVTVAGGATVVLSGPASGVESLAQTKNLLSCDYSLSGAPAAQPLISSAESALKATGLFRNLSLLAPIGAYVTENPLMRGTVILALEYQGTVINAPGVPAKSGLHATIALVCIERTDTKSVLAVGPAPW